MTRDSSRLHWLGFGLVVVVTQAVYLLTMTRTCPFWDSGEFIATSYILGIPHPPGTPLYVLIGRFFSLLPLFPEVASRVNWLSALSSSLASAFSYWMIVELWTRARGRSAGGLGAAGISGSAGNASNVPVPGTRPARLAVVGGLGGWLGSVRRALPQEWAGCVAGFSGAFFLAFSRTFWDNAIEAEVYALSSLIMALSGWLILRWARWEGPRLAKNGLFALLYYLLCLSMGIHLGTFLVLPGIVLFGLLVDRSSFGEGVWSAWFVAGLLLLLHPGMLPTLGLKVWGPLVGVVALSAVLFGGKWPAVGLRGILTWCLLLALVGISTHAYLMIRAQANPGINEADPESWGALWRVLTRDQYKPANPFLERQAPWGVQLTKHFWDYARDQYALGLRLQWLGWLLPYALGLWGAWGQLRRDRRGFVLLGVSYLIMSLGLVFYLNFKTEEVRPRDYFFVASFQYFALWIGLGSGWLVGWLGRSAEGGVAAREPGASERAAAGTAAAPSGGGARWLTWGGGALLCLLPFSTCRHYWFEHDRTEFYVARDFAYNMLTPLKPNAILFTNGDNDTFPLWYLQQVEGIRRDVQVANLSLLNTGWYIKQLRDENPKVDFGWSDAEIARLRPYLDPRTRRPMYLNTISVHRTAEREYRRRPIYLAVTVPDQMGLEDRLEMQGLAFELVEPMPGARERIDADLTLRLNRETFLFRGLLRPDGTTDEGQHMDENARRLLQNYSAGLIRAAEDKVDRGDTAAAEGAIAMAGNLTPWSRPIRYSIGVLLLRMQRFVEAQELFEKLIASGPVDSRLYRLYGRVLEGQDRPAEAEQAYRRALELEPESFDVLMDLASYLWQVARRPEAAIEALRAWDQRHPGDRRVRQAIREIEDATARAGGS
jgi:tetratricopeptide (TPR) repeat protein